jgi:hypothetical protein
MNVVGLKTNINITGSIIVSSLNREKLTLQNKNEQENNQDGKLKWMYLRNLAKN